MNDILIPIEVAHYKALTVNRFPSEKVQSHHSLANKT